MSDRTIPSGEAALPATGSSADGATERRRVGLGILLMGCAMLIIPGADAAAKYLSGSHSPVFLSWARYVAALAFVLPVVAVARSRERLPLLSRRLIVPQLLRTGFLVGAMTLYFEAVSRIPLADALGAYFIAPIAATLIAAVFLRERLDRRKLAAVLLGFAGAMLVVRPDMAGSAGTLIALASGGMMACYLVLTRMAKGEPPLATLTTQLVFGVLMLAPFIPFQWVTPSWQGLVLIMLMGLLSAASNLMTITAFRLASVGTLSPLVYLELVGATALGFAVFGDLPAPLTWLGIAVIVVAGLIIVAPAGRQRRAA